MKSMERNKIIRNTTINMEAEAKRLFDMIDTDGSGSISTKELQNVMRGLGCNPTDEEIKNMIKAVDENDSGLVEFEEFKPFLENMEKDKSKEPELLREAFERIGKDKEGKVDKRKLRDTLKKYGMSEEDCEDMFKLCDTNEDGYIQYEELVQMWTQ
ncbi:hypothetical protein ACF0H5_002378 [Mactra antiquata]